MTVIPAPPLKYSGNGTQTDFPITSAFYITADVTIYVTDSGGNQVPLTPGDYSIIPGLGARPGGGTLSFVTAPEADWCIEIEICPACEQNLSLEKLNASSGPAIEQALDRMIQSKACMQREIDSKVSLADGPPITLPHPQNGECEQVLAVHCDADGNPIGYYLRDEFLEVTTLPAPPFTGTQVDWIATPQIQSDGSVDLDWKPFSHFHATSTLTSTRPDIFTHDDGFGTTITHDVRRVGEVMHLAYDAGTLPGWIKITQTDQTAAIATYPALFSLLGTTWGPTAGGQFALPPALHAVVGAGTSTYLTSQPVGQTWGAEQASLSVANLAPHSHTYQFRAIKNGHGDGLSSSDPAAWTPTVSGTTSPAGGGQPFPISAPRAAFQLYIYAGV